MRLGGGNTQRDALGEESGVVQEVAQANLVIALRDRRVAVHRNAQRSRGEPQPVRPDACSGLREPGGRIEWGQTKAWVAHDE